MMILLMIVLLQSLILAAFLWCNRVAWLRILVLQQQLAVYKRNVKKPLLNNRGRLFYSQGFGEIGHST